MNTSQLTRRAVLASGVAGMTTLVAPWSLAAGSAAEPAAASGTLRLGGDLTVNRMGFGAMRLTGEGIWGEPKDPAEARRVLRRAVELGVDFIDTADFYTAWVPGNKGGESETIIGKWLATGNKRSNVIVATKVGLDMGNGKKGLKGAYIEQAVEDSLRRLQTDYIDLYQAHLPDPETPIDETLRAFDDLVRSGKVRYAGCSNYSAWQLALALGTSEKHGWARYDCVQPR